VFESVILLSFKIIYNIIKANENTFYYSKLILISFNYTWS
jgi:hypothetical protein